MTWSVHLSYALVNCQKFGIASNILSFELWRLWNISNRAPLMWFFFFTLVSFPLELHLCHPPPLSPFMLISSLSLTSSGCLSRVSQMAACQCSHFSYFIYTPLLFNLNFTSGVITFLSFIAFVSFWVNSIFWLFILLKCHLGLSPGDNTTHLHALLSISELNKKC